MSCLFLFPQIGESKKEPEQAPFLCFMLSRMVDRLLPEELHVLQRQSR